MSLPSLYGEGKPAKASQLAAQLRKENLELFKTRYIAMPKSLERNKIKRQGQPRSLSRVEVPVQSVQKLHEPERSMSATPLTASQ